MPSYEEVVLSLEADGFTVLPGSLHVLEVGPEYPPCDHCGESVALGGLGFNAVIEPNQPTRCTFVCLDRAKCRTRKAERADTAEREAAEKTAEREAAVAAAVILDDDERFPEHGD
jgi:hypothetical protein